MARFLNTAKAYAEIEDIVSKTERSLVLITPYIRMPRPFLERVKYAAARQEVQITVVCRRDGLRDEVREDLLQVHNLELRFLDSLHAKCFYNEKSMVITSLNLYEYSQQNNREMGVLLTAAEDGAVFQEALQEAEFIVGTSTPEPRPARPASRRSGTQRAKPGDKETASTVGEVLTADVGDVLKKVFPTFAKMLGSSDERPERNTGRQGVRKEGQGYCIRCGEVIAYDTNKPYCLGCHSEWRKYGNPHYEERYCHACGSLEPSTMMRPRCGSCYAGSSR